MRDEWIVCERGYPAESCAATADVQAVASGTGIPGVGTARECASQPNEAAAGEIANTYKTVQDAPEHYVREARLKPSPVRQTRNWLGAAVNQEHDQPSPARASGNQEGPDGDGAEYQRVDANSLFPPYVGPREATTDNEEVGDGGANDESAVINPLFTPDGSSAAYQRAAALRFDDGAAAAVVAREVDIMDEKVPTGGWGLVPVQAAVVNMPMLDTMLSISTNAFTLDPVANVLPGQQGFGQYIDRDTTEGTTDAKPAEVGSLEKEQVKATQPLLNTEPGTKEHSPTQREFAEKVQVLDDHQHRLDHRSLDPEVSPLHSPAQREFGPEKMNDFYGPEPRPNQASPRQLEIQKQHRKKRERVREERKLAKEQSDRHKAQNKERADAAKVSPSSFVHLTPDCTPDDVPEQPFGLTRAERQLLEDEIVLKGGFHYSTLQEQDPEAVLFFYGPEPLPDPVIIRAPCLTRESKLAQQRSLDKGQTEKTTRLAKAARKRYNLLLDAEKGAQEGKPEKEPEPRHPKPSVSDVRRKHDAFQETITAHTPETTDQTLTYLEEMAATHVRHHLEAELVVTRLRKEVENGPSPRCGTFKADAQLKEAIQHADSVKSRIKRQLVHHDGYRKAIAKATEECPGNTFDPVSYVRDEVSMEGARVRVFPEEMYRRTLALRKAKRDESVLVAKLATREALLAAKSFLAATEKRMQHPPEGIGGTWLVPTDVKRLYKEVVELRFKRQEASSYCKQLEEYSFYRRGTTETPLSTKETHRRTLSLREAKRGKALLEATLASRKAEVVITEKRIGKLAKATPKDSGGKRLTTTVKHLKREVVELQLQIQKASTYCNQLEDPSFYPLTPVDLSISLPRGRSASFTAGHRHRRVKRSTENRKTPKGCAARSKERRANPSHLRSILTRTFSGIKPKRGTGSPTPVGRSPRAPLAGPAAGYIGNISRRGRVSKKYGRHRPPGDDDNDPGDSGGNNLPRDTAPGLFSVRCMFISEKSQCANSCPIDANGHPSYRCEEVSRHFSFCNANHRDSHIKYSENIDSSRTADEHFRRESTLPANAEPFDPLTDNIHRTLTQCESNLGKEHRSNSEGDGPTSPGHSHSMQTRLRSVSTVSGVFKAAYNHLGDEQPPASDIESGCSDLPPSQSVEPPASGTAPHVPDRPPSARLASVRQLGKGYSSNSAGDGPVSERKGEEQGTHETTSSTPSVVDELQELSHEPSEDELQELSHEPSSTPLPDPNAPIPASLAARAAHLLLVQQNSGPTQKQESTSGIGQFPREVVRREPGGSRHLTPAEQSLEKGHSSNTNGDGPTSPECDPQVKYEWIPISLPGSPSSSEHGDADTRKGKTGHLIGNLFSSIYTDACDGFDEVYDGIGYRMGRLANNFRRKRVLDTDHRIDLASTIALGSLQTYTGPTVLETDPRMAPRDIFSPPCSPAASRTPSEHGSETPPGPSVNVPPLAYDGGGFDYTAGSSGSADNEPLVEVTSREEGEFELPSPAHYEPPAGFSLHATPMPMGAPIEPPAITISAPVPVTMAGSEAIPAVSVGPRDTPAPPVTIPPGLDTSGTWAPMLHSLPPLGASMWPRESLLGAVSGRSTTSVEAEGSPSEGGRSEAESVQSLKAYLLDNELQREIAEKRREREFAEKQRNLAMMEQQLQQREMEFQLRLRELQLAETIAGHTPQFPPHRETRFESRGDANRNSKGQFSNYGEELSAFYKSQTDGPSQSHCTPGAHSSATPYKPTHTNKETPPSRRMPFGISGWGHSQDTGKVLECPTDEMGRYYHPLDPKHQQNMSDDACRMHWIAFYRVYKDQQALVYKDSEEVEMIKHVLGAKKDRAGDKWHTNSLYHEDKVLSWVDARILQRTRGRSKDSSSAIQTLTTMRFPADLRKGEDPLKMARAWEFFRLNLIRGLDNALTNGCDWPDVLNALNISSRSQETGQQRVNALVKAAIEDIGLQCNPLVHANVFMAKLDLSFSQGAPAYSRETPSAMWESCHSRLHGEDASTLAYRILDSFLQKIGNNDVDRSTVWLNETYAHEINTRMALCLGNDLSDSSRGSANFKHFTQKWHEALQKYRSGGCKLHEMTNTYIASHHIATSELAEVAARQFKETTFTTNRNSNPRTVAAVQRQEPANNESDLVATLKQELAQYKATSQKRSDRLAKPTVAVATPDLEASQPRGKGKGGDRQPYNVRGNGGGRGYGGGTPRQSLPGLPSLHRPREQRYGGSRKCAPPSGSTGSPTDEVWTRESWETGVLVDFDEYERLADYPLLLPALAKSRPSDASMRTHRLGRPRTDGGAGGVWSNENGCAYCAFRPVAPHGTQDSDLWYYGNNNGAHSPYRCQCYIRFLAEGGGAENTDDLKPFLQNMLSKKVDRQ
jgi:hypothetical protein